jgi:hypothetical protein
MEIKCKDEHIFKMLTEYLEKRCTLVAYELENKICVYSNDEMESGRLYDNVAYQLDTWKDLKAEINFV